MSLLREGEAKKSLQLFMDSLPDGVMILARDGTIEMANQAQERLTGILNKQILGQTIMMTKNGETDYVVLYSKDERLLVVSSGDIITLKDLPPDLLPNLSEGAGKIIVNGLLPLKQAVLEVERQLIEQGLATFGSTLKVAEVLGVHQTTVIRKMAKANKNRRRGRKNKLKE